MKDHKMRIKLAKVKDDQMFENVLAIGGDPAVLEPHCRSLTHYSWADDLEAIAYDWDDETAAREPPSWTHVALFAEKDELRDMGKVFSKGGQHCDCCTSHLTTKRDQLYSVCNLSHIRDEALRSTTEKRKWLIIDRKVPAHLNDGLFWLEGNSQSSPETVT